MDWESGDTIPIWHPEDRLRQALAYQDPRNYAGKAERSILLVA